MNEFEFLVGQKSGIRWVDAPGKLDLGALNATPVEGGHEADGTPLFVAKAEVEHNDAKFVVPGKASQKLKGAFVAVGDTEKAVDVSTASSWLESLADHFSLDSITKCCVSLD